MRPQNVDRERHSELVRVGDAEFYVELAESDGPVTVGLKHALSFDGVRQTIEAVADQLGQAWDRTRPTEASVEFGLALTAKSGALTGLIVDADGSANLKITLTWKSTVG